MPTFAELGIPFTLYDAPVESCSDYEGEQYCCVSGERRKHCFSLGVGGYIRVQCPKCGEALYLRPIPDQFRPTACRYCGAPTPPPLVDSDSAYVSYEVLKAGDALFTKDTDLGMVSWEQLVDGWTHGIPEGSFSGVETRTTEEGWVQVKLPQETLRELVMTPDFVSWQGAVWMFEGATPMTFVGEWKRKDFEVRTPSGMNSEAFFRSVIRDCDDRLWEYADGICIYVFRNPKTGRYAANYDMD
jgi:hypothetical protein